MSDDSAVLAQLMAVLEDRRQNRPPNSYTTQLLAGGVDGIGAKLCEEVYELIEAARLAKEAPQDVVHEAADVLYHLLVMLAHCQVQLADVETELARRFGTSGLEEKKRRNPGNVRRGRKSDHE